MRSAKQKLKGYVLKVTIRGVFASMTAYDKKLKRHRDIKDAITFYLGKETRC